MSIKIGVSREIGFRDRFGGFLLLLSFRLVTSMGVQGGGFDDRKIKGGGAFLRRGRP